MTPNRTAQRWILALTSLGSFLVVLDMLVVATALTTIHRDLGASMQDLEWTVNAYTLSFAVLLMSAAAVGDRYGRRGGYAAGLALFAAASAACALSTNVAVLVAARAVQGIGAAAVMPLALSLLNASFPPQQRGRAMGIYGSVTGLAAALGPVVGGAVTQALTWQWIFWINVPIAVAAIPFVLTKIPASRVPGVSIDLPGLGLAGVAALGFAWALVRAGTAGWGSTEILAAAAAGAAGTLGFIVWENTTAKPMLPMRLFAARGFSAGNVAIFCLNASLAGAVFFGAQFLQVGLGHGALAAGLRLLPWGIAPLLVAPRAGALADRIGERPLVVTGLVLQAAGMAWMAIIASPTVPYAWLAVPMTLAGVGFSLALPPLTKAVVGSVGAADIGKASGAFSTTRQLGGAFGVAILSVAFASNGHYGSASAFTSGYSRAMLLAAGLAVVAALAGLRLPARTPRAKPAIATAGAQPELSRQA
ncbi:MAG TPA: DHA2 family efflux MFS transporter permease subunit [Streptosporangiaceae bacterium]|jgi:EmrB/QacA subfamily drug resistance transporter